jgi:hypothetical protein
MKSIDAIIAAKRVQLLNDKYFMQNPSSLESILNVERKHLEAKKQHLERLQNAGKRKQNKH